MLGPAREHAVRLVGALVHQVINEHPDVGFAPFEHEWLFAVHLIMGVDAGHQALAGGLLVARGAVYLAREVQARNQLSLQSQAELSRRKKIVLNSVAGAEHLGLLEARDFAQGAVLHIFRQRAAEAVHVAFHGTPAFRLYENLVPVLVREAVDFVFHARAVARPEAFDAALKHG